MIPRALFHRPAKGQPWRTNTIALGNYLAGRPDAEREKIVKRTIVWCARVNRKLKLEN
jgi:hypothetical protein